MENKTNVRARSHRSRAKAMATARMLRNAKIREYKKRADLLNASIKTRYVGLVLVQGSSALVLLNMDFLIYWSILWLGLCCYQFSALINIREAQIVYRETKEKYERGRGSTEHTVQAVKVKRQQEMPYVIGNAIGLVLVGWNIYTNIS